MKFMKKALLIFLGLIVLIIAALAIIPIFFKDEINAKIKAEINKSLDAKVDYKDVGLTFFRNFPNLTITVDDVYMVGTKNGFKNDTLFSAGNFRAAVDVMSVISGDQIKVKGVYLEKPYILTRFLKDGRMSWDIAKATPGDTAKQEPEQPSNFSLGIEEWKIDDGTIIYDDQSMPMYTELRHVNHKGQGEMVGDVFSILDSKTSSPEFYLSYDNVTYLNKHSLDADVKFSMDMKNAVYKLIDNHYKINDFKMKYDGEFVMPGNDINMKMKFSAEETDFKNLLSLVPAMYTKDFENIKTEGKIGFDGYCEGVFNETSMPGFGVNLVVNNAMFQYPNLTPVNNIGVDMKVDCKDGNMNNLTVDLKKFNMDMGRNPVSATAFVKGIGPMDVNADVKATLDLADISKMYPIEGTDLKGIFNLVLHAKGTYDDANKLMPTVNAKMALANGYVKSKDVPFPLENMNLSAVANSDGSMQNSNLKVEGFKMVLNGEPFEMKAFVENFENIKYDVAMKGIIDLEKLTKIYPIEGMTLAGRINADIETKGLMSDVEAGKYEKTQTSGTMAISNFKYITADMPAVTLSSANFSLTPEKMSIDNLDGFLGKSDINVKGYFANYMGYMFGKSGDTTIHGNMKLLSKKFDTNEWMPADEGTPATEGAEEPMTVFEVPRDIDFLFASDINKLLYDSMTMSNMTGNIIMKDGILKMDRLAFNALGGSFLTNGSYNTQNLKEPKFDFALNIKDMQLKEAYTNLSMVKKYAPVAKDMEGTCNTDLTVAGLLGQDMMPVYKTVNGAGKLFLGNAQIKGNKTLGSIGKLTGMKNLDPLAMKDVNVKFKITDGNLVVDPFDVKAGDAKMNISGKQSLEGNLDYLAKMEVPAGQLGSSLNKLAGLGGSGSGNEIIKFDVKIGGTYNDPKVGLGNSTKEQAKEVVADKVKDEIKNNEDVKKAQEQVDKQKKEAEEKLLAEQERLKKEAEEKRKAEEERVKKEAADKLKKVNPFKK